MNRCYCDRQKPYADCCGPAHQGIHAETPVALMRSRFSAFSLNNKEYLLRTWHASTRPETLMLNPGCLWKSLKILSYQQSASKSDVGGTGRVHFKAFFWEEGRWGYLEEKSNFVYEGRQWFYLDGDSAQAFFQPSRNEACPCGSGKKHKRCCLNYM